MTEETFEKLDINLGYVIKTQNKEGKTLLHSKHLFMWVDSSSSMGNPAFFQSLSQASQDLALISARQKKDNPSIVPVKASVFIRPVTAQDLDIWEKQKAVRTALEKSTIKDIIDNATLNFISNKSGEALSLRGEFDSAATEKSVYLGSAALLKNGRDWHVSKENTHVTIPLKEILSDSRKTEAFLTKQSRGGLCYGFEDAKAALKGGNEKVYVASVYLDLSADPVPEKTIIQALKREAADHERESQRSQKLLKKLIPPPKID